MRLISFIIALLLLTSPVYATTLFTTDFEGDDWTHTQPTGSSSVCLSSCGMSNGFTMYYDGITYCGSVGNNNFYMDTGAGYPGTTSSCAGGSKCATFWTEGCTNAFEDSDGNMGSMFTDSDEVYLTFKIRWQSTYTFTDNKQQKLFHIQFATAGQSPWSYFSGTTNNFPVFVGGLYRYGNTIYVSLAPRCAYYSDGSTHCDLGSPSYCPTYGNCDYELASIGSTSALQDGEWHTMKFRFKMNTGTTSNFNADGIMQFWYDGELKATHTGVPWNKSTSGLAKRLWNFVSIGGNNNLEVSGEQWWAVDDVCVNTADEACTTGGDTTAPATTADDATKAISSNSYTAEGDATDAVGVSGCKWRIGSAPDATHGTACTGTTSWSCATSGYSSGENTLYVGCYDAAGNYGTDTIVVTYTPPVSATKINWGSGTVINGAEIR